MTFEVVIKPDAERDISESAIWYEKKVTGLGRDFLDALETMFLRLETRPLIYQPRYKLVRMAKLKRFPFCVHFTIEKEKIIVHAVLHTKKSPRIWLKRQK
ncbi:MULTISPECIES: type II toxin-antitoxin system RelE/ParE family toxin [unclassified Imperialibacter]|uniref:type II toxin-antitoxin system RelE/ParE family toxin n=1 Tax=unclassified Imperialibacter TaxID=2629706 RepID=UPI00125AEED1|nr:conserved hypothetical protein [Imperialibacter sp. 75]CAD5288238.1 conserved hypothetical protein [Imperialibacter sp. 89]VVT35599.1 conserved hypothetical protein [Imperialibacter sp. EC-SDR9]